MIVVISHAGDPHAVRVIELLRRHGKDVVLLDLSLFPTRASLTVDYDDCACGRPRLRYRTQDG